MTDSMTAIIAEKNVKLFAVSEKMPTFATSKPKTIARMAESVDATVSNTVGAIHPGSIPGPGTNDD